jgi:hypothetical protein
VLKTEAGEAQETMLAWPPVKLSWNSNANEAAVIHRQRGFLSDPILEACPQPRIYITRDVDCCCSDEVIPVNTSVMGLTVFEYAF